MSNSIIRRIYDLSPSPLQTGALNLYGIHNRRRLRAFKRILESISDSEYWHPEQQRRYVARRLRVLLGHAVRHVPRYAGLRPLLHDIENPAANVFEVLACFPSISRHEILADPRAFLSDAFDPRRLKTTVTSGTTGSPFTTWIESTALLTSDALWWRRTLWAGYRPGDWIARLVGDPVIPLTTSDPRLVHRSSWTDRRLYFSTYHLSERTAPRIAQCLLRRGPAFLMGYPSALDALARLSDGVVDLSSWSPRAVLYSSEPLYEHQRESISRLVDAPLRGLYGCAERVVSAAQCPAGSHHVSLIDGFVEGQFNEAPLSQPARITGLLNRAMPLIRYELGDLVTPLTGVKCSCGRTLPLISPVVTKLEDSVTTPAGRVISPSILTWAFKDLPSLRKSQILQRTDSSIEVILEAAPRDFVRCKELLRSRLEGLVFGELSISFRRVDALDVTMSGKTRFVVDTRVGTPTLGSCV